MNCKKDRVREQLPDRVTYIQHCLESKTSERGWEGGREGRREKERERERAGEKQRREDETAGKTD